MYLTAPYGSEITTTAASTWRCDYHQLRRRSGRCCARRPFNQTRRRHPVRRHRRPVTSVFFTELADVLDRVSIITDPIVVVGDINIQFTRHGQVDNGAVLTSTNFALHWCRHFCVVLTHGPTSTLMSIVKIVKPPGLTSSVDWRSAVSDSWNVRLALPPSIPPRPPPSSGQLTVAPTMLCSARSR